MPKFPFTNYHELNLDWILKKVNALFDASEENAQTIRTYNTRLTAAEQTATNANTAATAAQQLAYAASENADDALAVAGTADSKAESALTAATTAVGAAAGAMTTAQEARQIAGSAQSAAADAGAVANDASNAAAAAQQTADTNAGNIANLQTAVDTLSSSVTEIDNKADVIIDSASGSIASFADGANDMPIRSLVVNIEPSQSGSGVPSPTNVRPITGRTGCSVVRMGKNILNESTPDYTNTLVAADGTAATNNNYNTWELNKSGTFTVAVNVTETTNPGRVVVIKNNGTVVSASSFSVTVGRHSITFTVATDEHSLISIRKSATEIQLEIGSSATSYEQYKTPTTVAVSWQSEAGTIYGGFLDIITGVLTVDRIIKNSGFARGALDSSGKLYNIGALTNAKPTTNTGLDIPEGIICNYGNVVTLQRARDLSPEKVFAYYGPSNVAVFAGGYVGNETELDSILASLQFVYPITSPTVYQLTPQQLNTLLGSNNIYSDVGSIADVQYPADTKLYIDGKIAELQALVLEN